MVDINFLVFSFTLLSLSCEQSSFATLIITPAQLLRDDGNTIVSENGKFALGFFSPVDSTNRYIGIWYKRIPIQTVVWVANRNSPLNDSSGVFKIEVDGNLVLLNGGKSIVWSSNSSKSGENLVAELLDSGNLVIKDGNSISYLWQSFDYPSDTLLPGMKLGWDLKKGLNRYLSAWKNYDDPSVGDLTYRLINIHGYPEAALMKGSVEFYRSGPWNGIGFSGIQGSETNSFLQSEFVDNDEEVYYIYQHRDSSLVSVLAVNQTSGNGVVHRVSWVEPNRKWDISKSWPKDLCDTYKMCGAYSSCDIDASPSCNCLKGFKPRSPQAWRVTDNSQGCVHETPLNCTKGDDFLTFTGIKLPDTTNTWVNMSMDFEECRVKCLNNCSCMAYTNMNVTGRGSGCVIWSGDLFDIRQFNGTTQNLYIRKAASEKGGSGGSRSNIVVIVIVTVVTVGMLLLGLGGCFIWHTKRKSKGLKEKIEDRYTKDENQDDELQLPLFDLDAIKTSTNDFSDANKLGEGGFGPVYKGELGDGHEIAVKRLSKKSTQGINEFKNEVILISKLQHRNLVRLLGCCIQGEEKMLIYEYMPNKSLDFFIFDNTRNAILDWQKRFHIIFGIARGLLYLHQDSRLRIIHRDLKASNVLLDSKMDPKISDFGMARIFGGDQIEGNTERVAGTYGYMSPEYAIDGQFSVKSDVFSFGVLVLEIVSGMRNRGFYHPDHQLNLLGHAWRLWIEDKALDWIEKSIGGSCQILEVLRCIHVGLLCVQQRTEDRPIMSSVLLMLSSENAILPHPQRPGFFMERSPFKESQLSSDQLSRTSNDRTDASNEITVTLLEGR
ncbi:hypothetical protein GIB67_017352 [Kingdonia uniflora]|uniref:Receptor-like serine/threonine-protein kinase n=1 Tax=Kingdonia uniflora TaxID=39325 RepID=A0A7J7MQ31_9MAGN|nr:hypothetical protein GIB67_017352 [Kingdonia uniflora]